MDYTLKHPVQFGSEKIEVIKIGRPKGRHLQAMPGDAKLWDFVTIASKSSGVSIKVFEEMDGEDILAIAGEVGKLLVSSPATGS